MRPAFRPVIGIEGRGSDALAGRSMEKRSLRKINPYVVIAPGGTEKDEVSGLERGPIDGLSRLCLLCGRSRKADGELFLEHGLYEPGAIHALKGLAPQLMRNLIPAFGRPLKPGFDLIRVEIFGRVEGGFLFLGRPHRDTTRGEKRQQDQYSQVPNRLQRRRRYG